MANIWKQTITVEDMNQRGLGTLAELMGIKFTEIGDDYMICTMDVRDDLKQPKGILHGGANCVLAETVGSTASNAAVSQDTHYCVGLEINANHIRSATSGMLTAKTTPLQLGRKIHVWDIQIHNEAGKLTCVSRLTMAVLKR